MQILPFIFSFLIFFSISLSYFFEDIKESSILKKSQTGFFEACLNLENENQKQLYKTTAKAPAETKGEKGQTNAKEKKAVPARSSNKKTPAEKNLLNCQVRRIYLCSQLNIYPLLKEGKKQQEEKYLLLKKLLNYFYSSLLQEKGTDELLINSLIRQLRPLLLEEKEIDLSRAAFSDPKMQSVFYRILNGSGGYKGDGKTGYPALSDYVKICAGSNAKICLAKCPYDLLCALMGEKRADLLMGLKKNKNFKKPQILKAYATEKDVSFKHNYVVSHSNHKKDCLLLATDSQKEVILKKKL